jgi:hypothetical protein
MAERLGGASGLLPLALLAAALALGSCGGGVGSGGTGAPVQASGSGIVTGFGSVYIDGARYDDRDAMVETEVAPGVYANAALALGQSVEVGLADEGVAATIAIEPRLVAPVDAVQGGTLRVLGQTVRLNADPGAGPVTMRVGGTLRAGDWAEVHGFARDDGTLQATRVERLAQAPPQRRAAGRVDALRPDGTTFTLGALTVDAAGAVLRPSGAVLADGVPVVVFGERVGDRLRAAQVRVLERRSTAALDAQIAGRIDRLDGDDFSVGGVRVRAGDAELRPAGARLAHGVYVRVRGRYTAPDALVARRVDVRGGGAATAEPVELAGTLFDVNAAAGTARLRDMPVSTAGARLQGCGNGLRDGGYVEVRGHIDGARVVADTIRCRADEPRDATVERRGTAGPVDRVGEGEGGEGDGDGDDVGNGGGRDARPMPGRFTLTPLDGGVPIDVRIQRRTVLDAVDEASLRGRRVRVEGDFRGGVLVARVIAALP